MVRSSVCLLGLLAVLGGVCPASADMVVVQGAGNGLFPFPGGALDQSGTPFWNQKSMDGAALSVGQFLTGSGGYISNPAGVLSPNLSAGNLQFLAGAGSPGTPAGPVTFGGPVHADGALFLAMSSMSGKNEFGWYERATGTQHPLFGPYPNADHPNLPSLGTPLKDSFTAFDDFGFYIYTGNGNLFRSGDSPGSTHFAFFFDGNGNLWVGVEDLIGTSSKPIPTEVLGDFNDIVARFTFTTLPSDPPVHMPEPSTLALLAFGGLALLGYVRRQRSS